MRGTDLCVQERVKNVQSVFCERQLHSNSIIAEQGREEEGWQYLVQQSGEVQVDCSEFREGFTWNQCDGLPIAINGSTDMPILSPDYHAHTHK